MEVQTFLLIQEWDYSWRKTHLDKQGAIIGRTEYRDHYVKDLVKDWDNQLSILSNIAETQLQAVYLTFAAGFKSKLKYFLRTIPNIYHLLLPLERAIWNKFTPAVTGCHSCNDKERVLISLLTWCGDWPFQYFIKQWKLNLWTPEKSHQNLQHTI